MRPSFSEEIWKLRVSQVTLPVPLFAVVGARSAWTCKWTSATWNLQHINDIKLKWNGQFLFHPCTSLCYCQMLSKYNAWKENKQYVHLRHATPSLCFDSRLPLNGIGSPANPWNELSYQNQPHWYHTELTHAHPILTLRIKLFCWLPHPFRKLGRLVLRIMVNRRRIWLLALFSHDGIEHFPHNGASYRCGTCVVTYPYCHMRFPCSSACI